MKSLLTVLFLTLTSLTSAYSQDAEKMDATFVGYEDDMYVFTDNEGYRVEFNNISKEASQKYDLTDPMYVGKQFILTFTVDTEMDEDDEEIQVSTIVTLMMPQ
ncbi:hypothetical protein [Maribacter sp. MAR_2009_72]|uniref:hypothetical protein n=1 Tax=Maribacter sp. MAR_2009_72 TaxID=1250050 RepID=UPI00119BFB71|nr:hypothetical protein [Maribacter sp. MAR_2009_72]TVZ16991.1 hypothetical protein JM81_3265 [Maribacter sp. MAR_2009_72]